MPLRPIATVIALLMLGVAVWLLIAAARHHRRWIGLLLRVTPALCLLGLVAALAPYILGLSGPHPFFNRAAPVPASTVIYHLVYSDPRASQQSYQTYTLIAIQGRTGKTLWQRVMPGGESALTDGGDTVYTISSSFGPGSAQLFAISAATGVIRWQETLRDTVAGYAPVLAHGVLYLAVMRTAASPGSQILAMRSSDGAHLWTAPIDDAPPGRWPALSVTADMLFVHPSLNSLEARRLTDGRLIWSESQIGVHFVIGSEAVYELADFGSLVARSAQTGAKLWQFGDHTLFHAGVVSGDTVYVTAQRSGASGATDARGKLINPETVYALDAASGRLRWTFATQSNNSGSLTAGRDSIYIRADDGIHALRALDGAQRWQSDPHNNWSFDAFPSPSVVDSTLYVSGPQTLPPETLTLLGPQKEQMYLYAVNEADGSVDWGVTIGPIGTIYPHWLS